MANWMFYGRKEQLAELERILGRNRWFFAKAIHQDFGRWSLPVPGSDTLPEFLAQIGQCGDVLLSKFLGGGRGQFRQLLKDLDLTNQFTFL